MISNTAFMKNLDLMLKQVNFEKETNKTDRSNGLTKRKYT